jgi:HD domain
MVCIQAIAPNDQKCGRIINILAESLFHDADEIIGGDIPTLGASEATMDAKHYRLANDLDKMRLRYPVLHELHYWLSVYHAQKRIETRPIRMVDKAAPSRTHTPNKGLVLKDQYGYDTPEKYLGSLRGPNKVMAAGYGDLPFYLAVINEARAQALVATYGVDLHIARSLVYDKSAEDGLFVPKTWNVLGSLTLANV